MSDNFIIPKNEVLRYLGYQNQPINSELAEKIDSSIALLGSIIRPKFIYRSYKLSNFLLSGTNFQLQGGDIKRHLQGCDSAIILASTLGLDVDLKLLELMVKDKTSAIIFDAAGSAAIESFLDDKCKIFENATTRFSCGYGDFPLSANADICNLLSATKTLGVSVNSSYLLSPKKSVTAVVGIGKNTKNKPLCNFDCKNCKAVKCVYIK